MAEIALVIAILSVLLAWRVSSRQNQLQSRVLELEEARERTHSVGSPGASPGEER
jgi:hypothetical protein